MSDDILARARAALDGVTPGPWVHDPKLFSNVYSDDATGSIVATCTGFTYARRPPADEAANARFIAFARSLVPEMADEIARLRAQGLREAAETILTAMERAQIDMTILRKFMNGEPVAALTAIARAAELEGKTDE
jgi:hypothetical protein